MSRKKLHRNWRRLSEATAYAFEIHANQVRKGANTPYIAHLMGVASLVLEYGGSEDQAIAGLLHDAIEDQGAHQEAIIRDRFGASVAEIVLGCTDANTTPKPPWKERKVAYIEHLKQASQDVLLVSCCDKIYNSRTICCDLKNVGLEVYNRFAAGQSGTLWYYISLVDVFEEVLPGKLSVELRDSVTTMVDLTKVLSTERLSVALQPFSAP